MNIADLRREYSRAVLDESSVHPDPLEQFRAWFDEARQAEAIEPNAMTLATVDGDRRPSARIVLLKGVDAGFVFFTDYRSRKGTEAPRPAPGRRPGVLLGRARATSARRRSCRAARCSRIVGVFPHEARGGTNRRVGIAPERGAARSRHTRAPRRRRDSGVCRPRHPAASALGRISRCPAGNRVLARAGKPAARPDSICARRLGSLAPRPALAVIDEPPHAMSHRTRGLADGVRLAGLGVLANALLAVIKGSPPAFSATHMHSWPMPSSRVADIGGSLVVWGGLPLSASVRGSRPSVRPRQGGTSVCGGGRPDVVRRGHWHHGARRSGDHRAQGFGTVHAHHPRPRPSPSRRRSSARFCASPTMSAVARSRPMRGTTVPMRSRPVRHSSAFRPHSSEAPDGNGVMAQPQSLPRSSSSSTGFASCAPPCTN